MLTFIFLYYYYIYSTLCLHQLEDLPDSLKSGFPESTKVTIGVHPTLYPPNKSPPSLDKFRKIEDIKAYFIYTTYMGKQVKLYWEQMKNHCRLLGGVPVFGPEQPEVLKEIANANPSICMKTMDYQNKDSLTWEGRLDKVQTDLDFRYMYNNVINPFVCAKVPLYIRAMQEGTCASPKSPCFLCVFYRVKQMKEIPKMNFDSNFNTWYFDEILNSNTVLRTLGVVESNNSSSTETKSFLEWFLALAPDSKPKTVDTARGNSTPVNSTSTTTIALQNLEEPNFTKKASNNKVTSSVVPPVQTIPGSLNTNKHFLGVNSTSQRDKTTLKIKPSPKVFGEPETVETTEAPNFFSETLEEVSPENILPADILSAQILSAQTLPAETLPPETSQAEILPSFIEETTTTVPPTDIVMSSTEAPSLETDKPQVSTPKVTQPFKLSVSDIKKILSMSKPLNENEEKVPVPKNNKTPRNIRNYVNDSHGVHKLNNENETASFFPEGLQDYLKGDYSAEKSLSEESKLDYLDAILSDIKLPEDSENLELPPNISANLRNLLSRVSVPVLEDIISDAQKRLLNKTGSGKEVYSSDTSYFLIYFMIAIVSFILGIIMDIMFDRSKLKNHCQKKKKTSSIIDNHQNKNKSIDDDNINLSSPVKNNFMFDGKLNDRNDSLKELDSKRLEDVVTVPRSPNSVDSKLSLFKTAESATSNSKKVQIVTNKKVLSSFGDTSMSSYNLDELLEKEIELSCIEQIEKIKSPSINNKNFRRKKSD